MTGLTYLIIQLWIICLLLFLDAATALILNQEWFQ
jgi:hypothetical protein